MAKDNKTARGEDQVAAARGGMSPKGGKGPTAASAADTPGAFGDREHPEDTYSNVDKTLINGPDAGEGGKV